MKRFFILLSMALCMLTASAQMNIWRGGYYTQYSFEEVDSITFGKILTLSDESLTLAVGDTCRLTANMPVEKWETSNAEVATVVDGLITAISVGTTYISATAKGITKHCRVGVYEVKGSKFWPVIMDVETLEANQSKMVASFQPNDVDQFLYIWENTYVAGNGDGFNSMGKAEGYTSLVVGTVGWSGAGFWLSEGSGGMKACQALRDSIVANPDQYFLHMAIKSTDQASHTFFIMNTMDTKFVLGTPFDGGTAIENFARDGKWHHYDIPMTLFADALVTADLTAWANIFAMLSDGTPGVQLNLDAVYFYKK